MYAAKSGTGKNSAHHVLEAPDAARGQNSCLSPFLPPACPGRRLSGIISKAGQAVDTGMAKRIRYLSLLSLIATGIYLLFPSAVSANSGIGSAIYLTATPSLVTLKTMGLALVLIVLVEALVFWRILRLSFPKALWISFAANLISTFLGLISTPFAMYPASDLGAFLIPAAVLAFWWYKKQHSLPAYVGLIVLLTVFLGSLLFLTTRFLFYSSLTLPKTVFFLLALLPNFGASVFVEGLAARWLLRRPNIWRAIVVANIISYILLVAGASYYFKPRDFDGATGQSWAKGTLRSLGKDQLAYRSNNNAKVYGSFQALKDTDYVPDVYQLDNMVDTYTMTWVVDSVSTAPSEEFPAGVMSTFTIIAYPRDTRPGYLNTFAITDDQAVRVFSPQNGNLMEDVKTWDPIL